MFGCWCRFIFRYNPTCSVFYVKPIGLPSNNGEYLPHFDTVKTVRVKQAIFPYVLLIIWLQKYPNSTTSVVINSHNSIANQQVFFFSKCPTCISFPKMIVTNNHLAPLKIIGLLHYIALCARTVLQITNYPSVRIRQFRFMV
jgi:hypothetical protein